MRVTLTGIQYKGQPVYRDYSEDKIRMFFFSRETKALPGGGWKFVRWVPLHEISIKRGDSRQAQADAIQHVRSLPGVTT